MKRTTIYLADMDRVAIDAIRKRFGMSTDSTAIRFALRVVADTLTLPVPNADNKEQEHE